MFLLNIYPANTVDLALWELRRSARRAAAATARARRPRGVGPRAPACASGPCVARPLRRRRARNGPGVVENATASSERSLETAGACWTCSGPRCPCFSGGVAERVATKTMSRETRTAPPSDHPTASIPRFSSIGGGQNEPVCGAATPLDVQSGSDALSRPITGAPLARASGERGTRQLQLGRLLPAPRKRHQHGLQRRRAHERGLALSLRRDILSRLQKTLGRRNGALRACFPAVGASPVHPSRTKPVQTRRIRPYILASAPRATAWGPVGLPGLAWTCVAPAAVGWTRVRGARARRKSPKTDIFGHNLCQSMT